MPTSRQDAFFAALIAQIPALRRYAMVLIGNASADDLVQDCIEHALRHGAKLEYPERIAGWLRSILHNLYVDQVRRKVRQGVSVDIGDIINDLSVTVPGHDPAAAVDFHRAMTHLTFEHRQILLLVGLEGLNYREVADELAIPMGTVMSRLARARERLRALLDRKDSTGSDAGDAP